MRKTVLALAATALFAGTSAWSCAFHNYAPQPTLVDRLLESEHIVLARPSDDDPFRFVATEALEGNLEHVELPHLVDSATRRKLASDPSARVLFVRDGAYGPWRRVAYVNDEMQSILSDVMAQLSGWRLGESVGRFDYFASKITTDDPVIHRLALRELDQADYGVLQSLRLSVPADRLIDRLNLIQEFDLKPIRILLLGLSGTPEAEGLLRAGIARNKNGSSLLGANVTALIELVGPDAVEEIASTYLQDPSLPEASHESFVEALALHSQFGSNEMQATIRANVKNVLRENPRLATSVARQFGARSDWSHVAALEEAYRNKEGLEMSDIIVMAQYISLAKQAAITEEN